MGVCPCSRECAFKLAGGAYSLHSKGVPAFEDAIRFGGFVLAHAAWIASDQPAGDLICPFAVVVRGNEHELIPFEADSQAEAISRGKASFDELRPKVNKWSLAREGLWGYVGENAPKKDAITVSSWVKGLDEALHLSQLFKPAASGRFELIGEITIIVHGMILSGSAHEKLNEIAMEGIAQHPQGWEWDSWRT